MRTPLPPKLEMDFRGGLREDMRVITNGLDGLIRPGRGRLACSLWI